MSKGSGEKQPRAGSTDVAAVDDELEDSTVADARTDSGLRKALGYGALAAMAAQILIADVAFFIYGFANDWDVPASAMHVWLVATVLQVAIIAQGIGRYLFPPDGPRPRLSRRSA